MHFNLINWLFQDPCTATGCYSGGPAPEGFKFYLPWIIFCALGLVVTFYYSVEGRKRFTKGRPALKYMLDRYFTWLAIICIIGFPLIGSRVALYQYFFAWRFWRYAWLLGLVIWAVLFIVHRFRRYAQERDYYQHLEKRNQYMPRANKSGKRKTAPARQ